jgi:tetratricopeptide (TPR) repeat protein
MKRILKLVLGAIGGLIALCIISSIIGSRNKAEREAAAQAAAERQAADNKTKLDKGVAALGTNLAPAQLVTTCMEVAKAGGIPPAHAVKCGDALLAEGQTALTAKRVTEALPLLEQAVKLSSKKADAQTALDEAKVAVAIETATADLKRAEDALAAKDFPKAVLAAKDAQKQVAAGLQTKADDATLSELKGKVEAVLMKADPEKRAAADKAAFATMNAKEHLAAAKAALADGYDSKRKWGGDIEGALRHLAAIAAPAPEMTEAKKLQQEVVARREREKVITCDCELVKGRLVVTEGPEDGAPADRLGDITVTGHSTLKSNAALWFELPEVTSITVIEFAKYNDVRGNEKTIKAAEFTVSRAKAKGIKWENIRTENVLKVIDKAWVAPGVAVLVDG